MVGVLGVAPLAAVGISRQVIMFMMVLMIAISGGSSVLIAHAYGARDFSKVSQIATRSLFFMLLTALFIVTPIGIAFSRNILVILGAKDQVTELGNSYLRLLMAGSIFTMFNFAITAILLGVGKTKISLYLLLGVNLLNIPFNYLLIFGIGPFPALGVSGAALGTVMARALGSLAGIWIITTPKLPIKVKFRNGSLWDFKLLHKIIYLGGPRSLQGIVRNLSRLIIIRIITLLPDATRAISAFSVGMQVRNISSFIGIAFMSASIVRVGQNMGRRKQDLAEKSGWVAAGMALVIMTFMALLFFLFPAAIMKFFTTDSEVITMGKNFFIIIAISEPVMAFAFALGGALRGGGDPISPFIYASLSDLFFVIIAGYLLAIQFQAGFNGIAIAITLSAFTRALPSLWKFRQGEWKKNRLDH